jgi:hypothetical protein
MNHPLSYPARAGQPVFLSLMGWCFNRNHVVTGSFAFAGDDRLFEATIPGQILSRPVSQHLVALAAALASVGAAERDQDQTQERSCET